MNGFCKIIERKWFHGVVWTRKIYIDSLQPTNHDKSLQIDPLRSSKQIGSMQQWLITLNCCLTSDYRNVCPSTFHSWVTKWVNEKEVREQIDGRNGEQDSQYRSRLKWRLLTGSELAVSLWRCLLCAATWSTSRHRLPFRRSVTVTFIARRLLSHIISDSHSFCHQ